MITDSGVIPQASAFAVPMASGKAQQYCANIGDNGFTNKFDGTFGTGRLGAAGAKIITADIQACNGVIHIIDNVLPF